MIKSIYPWQKIGKFHENDVVFSVCCSSDAVKGMQLVTPKVVTSAVRIDIAI